MRQYSQNAVSLRVNGEPIGRNLFCAGQCLLGDGRVLVVGGERDYHPNVNPQLPHDLNQKSVYVYDPEQHAWLARADRTARRWYPTVVTAGSNAGIAVGGDYQAYRDPLIPGPDPQASPAVSMLMPMGRGCWYRTLGRLSTRSMTMAARLAQYPFVVPVNDARPHIADVRGGGKLQPAPGSRRQACQGTVRLPRKAPRMTGASFSTARLICPSSAPPNPRTSPARAPFSA